MQFLNSRYTHAVWSIVLMLFLGRKSVIVSSMKPHCCVHVNAIAVFPIHQLFWSFGMCLRRPFRTLDTFCSFLCRMHFFTQKWMSCKLFPTWDPQEQYVIDIKILLILIQFREANFSRQCFCSQSFPHFCNDLKHYTRIYILHSSFLPF